MEKKAKILVVEDERLITSMLKDLLELKRVKAEVA